MALQIRRGTDSQRQGITPAEGELIYTTDTDKLYIGDGSTAGGIEVSGGVDSAAISAIISASSIDAAQLDGQNPSYYLNYNNLSNVPATQTDSSTVDSIVLNIVDSNYVQARETPQDFAYGSLTGTPTIPTNNSQLTNGAAYVTQAAVDSAITALIDGAPGALDTLNELAAALGDDAAFESTITNALATKLNLSGGTLTGTLVAQNIEPTTDDTYDLGSTTKRFRDLYLGPGSLYVNNKKVIEDESGTITFKTDSDQNLNIKTQGTGQTTVQSAAGINLTSTGSADVSITTNTGNIEMYGDVIINSTNSINSSNSDPINFGDNLDLNSNKIVNVGTPTNVTDAVNKTYVDNLNVSTFTNDAGYITGGIDSAAATALVDSSYVQARQTPQNFAYASLTGKPTIPTNNNQLTNGAGYLTSFTETNDLSSAVTWANVPNSNITQGSVTQHQAALSITESQISDLQSYLTSVPAQTFASLTSKPTTLAGYGITDGGGTDSASVSAIITADVDAAFINNLTIDADTLGGQNSAYHLDYNNFTNKPTIPTNNNQLTNGAGYITSFTETNDLSSAVTWANVPDTNITESSVTQHQAALSITESQISDLSAGTDSAAVTAMIDSNYVQARQANASPGATTIDTHTFTATAGQTVFSVNYPVGKLNVYLNGILLDPTDYTATNGTSITLDTGAAVNDLVNVITYTTTAVGTLDSAGVTGLVDSSYVQARQGGNVSQFTNDASYLTSVPAQTFASLTSKPTTIAGYGITDAFDGAYGSLTGAPTIPSLGNDFVDSAYVTTQVNAVIDAAPGALNTLNELAAALGDDANFSTTVTNQIAALPDSSQVSGIITNDVNTTYVQARQDKTYAALTGAPTNVSDFTNDAGYLTSATVGGLDSALTSDIITDDVDKAFVDALNVDADTLDGQDGTYYLNYNNFSNTPTIPTNNNQLTNGAGYLTSYTETNDLSSAVTWANVPNANITESSVTQHQAALSITESQISDLSKLDSAQAIAAITSSDLDMGGNKVLFGNVYSAESDLPNASSYHGMFAHVHATGAGYFAHGGNWIKLANHSELYADADVTALIDSAYVQARQTTGGGGTVDSADIIAIVDSDYIQARQTSGGGGSISSLSRSVFTFTATANQTVFTGTAGSGGTLAFNDEVDVYINGILLDPSDYTLSGGNTLTLASGTGVGNIVTVIDYGATALTLPSLETYTYTATSNQTTFSGSDGSNTLAYSVGKLNVYLNGILLISGTDYTATNGTSVVLASGADTGNILQVVAWSEAVTGTLDSDSVTNLIDSAYVTARAGAGTDSATVSAIITADVDASFINALTIDADTLGGQNSAYHLDYTNFTNTPTIPTNNNQLTNGAGYLTSFTETNDLSSAVTWANIPDANVPQSAVTQHQSALTITESQISDLAHTTSLAFSAITSTPTTLAGYGITDGGGTDSASVITLVGNTVDSAYVQNRQSTVSSGATTIDTSTFTATAGQTVFTVNYTVGKLNVYLNGILLDPSDYTATNGTSITLDTGAAVNDLVNVITYTTTAVGNLDSAGVTGVVNSAYIQARQGGNVSQFTNDAGYLTSAIDSAYVTTQIDSLIDAAPGALNTLNELAAAIGDDANFSTTITNQIAALPDSSQVSGIVTADVDKAFVDALGINATQLNSQAPSYYLDYNNFSNTPTIPTNNNQLTNGAGYLTSFTETNDLSSAVTWANVPNSNITEASVTQHQAALSITQSQISDLSAGTDSATVTAMIDSNYVQARQSTVTAGATTVNTTSFTATANQTTFSVNYTVGKLNVYLNGILLDAADFTATNGTSVVLGTAADVGDILHAITYDTVTASTIDSAGISSIITADVDASFINALTIDADTLGGQNSAYHLDYTNFTNTPTIPTNNNQLTNGAGYLTSFTETNDLSSAVTWANIPDANVPQSAVTQHQAALSITESQISDLGTYLTSSDLSTYATQTYVTNAVNDVIDAAPGALDTLNELAAALGDDANFSTTVTNQIAGKLDSAQAIATITGSDLDMGGNKVLFGNVYSAESDLPSASSYHGMFAHVHATGAGYFAHGGNWIKLANNSDIPSVIDSAGISSIITADVDASFVNGLGITSYANSDVDTHLNQSSASSNEVLSWNGSDYAWVAQSSGGGTDAATVSSIITADVDAAFVTNLGFTAGSGAATTSDGIDTTYVYTATANQTAFSGSDNNSATLSYTANSIMVYLNGILLIPTTDYTATNGTTITLASGAAANDEVMIVTVKSGPKTWTEKSGNYTATAGDKLFIDVSGGTATVTLPASPNMGNEVRVIDATGNAATNNITINRNGNNINGAADNLVLDVNRAAIGLAYYNSTQGWVLIER